jgi:hypothetical protein
MNFRKKLSNLIHLFQFVILFQSNHYYLILSLQSPVLSFSEVSKIRKEVQLPTADDIIAHLTNGNTNDVDLENFNRSGWQFLSF